MILPASKLPNGLKVIHSRSGIYSINIGHKYFTIIANNLN